MILKATFCEQELPIQLSEDRFQSGCGLVTRPDGSQYILVVGGFYSGSTSEILDLDTMQLSEGKIQINIFPRLGANIFFQGPEFRRA